ncbi:hypothetical protein B0H13DRAFT_1882406 [Mycena leptocephala]|nr:hypothetical protein B0H13DRAFT_1882406 [Mycena leptocephala]
MFNTREKHHRDQVGNVSKKDTTSELLTKITCKTCSVMIGSHCHRCFFGRITASKLFALWFHPIEYIWECRVELIRPIKLSTCLELLVWAILVDAAADGAVHSPQRRSRGQTFAEEIAAGGSTSETVMFPDGVEGCRVARLKWVRSWHQHVLANMDNHFVSCAFSVSVSQVYSMASPAGMSYRISEADDDSDSTTVDSDPEAWEYI